MFDVLQTPCDVFVSMANPEYSVATKGRGGMMTRSRASPIREGRERPGGDEDEEEKDEDAEADDDVEADEEEVEDDTDEEERTAASPRRSAANYEAYCRRCRRGDGPTTTTTTRGRARSRPPPAASRSVTAARSAPASRVGRPPASVPPMQAFREFMRAAFVHAKTAESPGGHGEAVDADRPRAPARHHGIAATRGVHGRRLRRHGLQLKRLMLHVDEVNNIASMRGCNWRAPSSRCSASASTCSTSTAGQGGVPRHGQARPRPRAHVPALPAPLHSSSPEAEIAPRSCRRWACSTCARSCRSACSRGGRFGVRSAVSLRAAVRAHLRGGRRRRGEPPREISLQGSRRRTTALLFRRRMKTAIHMPLPPLDGQGERRQKQFLSNGVHMLAAQNNVFLQRIPIKQLMAARMREDDVLSRALQKDALERNFKFCNDNGVNMRDSLEWHALMLDRTPANPVYEKHANSVAILAWRMVRGEDPALVGMLCAAPMRRTPCDGNSRR